MPDSASPFAPPLSETVLHELARHALGSWEIEVVSLDLHAQRENAIFRVESADGERYALRIHRPGYHDLPELESEHAFASTLADAGVSVPRALATREGRAIAVAPVPDSDQVRHVGLVNWLPGATLADHLGERPDGDEVFALYAALGGLMADLHMTAVDWSPPPGFVRHAWDADGLAGERPFWGRFWEIDAASAGERARLLEIRDEVLARLSALPREDGGYSMVHADLNADNVLRDERGLSIIDFDDAGFGWHAFDLAVALWSRLDALGEHNRYDEAYAGLVEAYRGRRGDCDRIIEQIPLFLLMRSLMLLRWMQDRSAAGYDAMIPMMLQLALAQAGEM